jgi:tetratricopeptide (TPR) repeat protein
LYFYANKDIQDILTMYPKIDITRYASEESRIKERSKAEELKQTEQRAYEERLYKEKEAAAEKAAVEEKTQENRKEAKLLFERAVELHNVGKFEDSRLNVENAISLDNINKEYKQFLDDLIDKIKKLRDKTELYKKYLSKADILLKNGELENALEEYEAASYISDNVEIIQKIIEVRRLIKNRETQKKQIVQLVSEASTLVQNKNFGTAKDKIDAILAVDSSNAEAKKLLAKIDETLQEIEFQYKNLIKEADINLRELRFEPAINIYNKALKIKPNDDYCLGQLKVVVDKKASLKPPPPPPPITPKPVNTKPASMAPPIPLPTKAKPLSNGASPKNFEPPSKPPTITPKQVSTKPALMAPPIPLPIRDKLLSNGASPKHIVPPPPPNNAPKSDNNGKNPPPSPSVPQKK